jgi:hypothetical protein
MKNMMEHASFIRRLLDDAACIIRTAREDRERGQDVGIPLNHAGMLLRQIESTYPSLDRLAEGVAALYERRSTHWTHDYGRAPMSYQVYPDLQDRIDLLTSKLEQVRQMDAGAPDSRSPEAYRHLVLNHAIGRLRVLDLAEDDTAPPSIAAAEILHAHYRMMCCIMNGRTFRQGDRWAMQAIVEWINWTGWALHNMAEMTTGKHDRWHPEFFVSECSSFVARARTGPVPADWHPDDRRSHDHPGPAWKRLCDFVALKAGMEPAYGVPVEPRQSRMDIPPYPEPPRAILGLHTSGSIERYSYRVSEWCHEWGKAQLAAISLWPPSDEPNTDQTD